jgi:hypothetical protein
MGAPSTGAATWKICYPPATPLLPPSSRFSRSSNIPARLENLARRPTPPLLAVWQQGASATPMLGEFCGRRDVGTEALAMAIGSTHLLTHMTLFSWAGFDRAIGRPSSYP